MRLVSLLAMIGVLQGSLAFGAGPAPRPADEHSAERLHGIETRRASTPDRRAPATPVDRQGRVQRPSRVMNSASASAAVAAICSTSEFQSLSGSALVNKIKSCDVTSLYDLYSLTGTAAFNTFQEAKMASVAYGLRDTASSYPGNNSTQTLQLVTYLRAGYYVQYYNPGAVGQYGASLRTGIRAALDAFFANANSLIANDANGEILSEVIVLVDSSTENARYLSRMTDLLNRFDNLWLASWYMRAAANSVYTVTFRGHQNADFRSLIQTDQRIIDALYNFHNRWTSLLGTSNGYLTSNAAREMARFLQHAGTVQTKTRPLARDLLSRSSITGATAPVYIGVAEMVEYYDAANCGYYGTCTFRQDLEAIALPVSYTCSATLRIRAQEMTSAQLSSTCATQAAEATRFHGMLETGNVAIAGDLNDDLEMVVFDSSTDYQTYAGVLFGIDTNNGGMYLEGDPTNASNQARFIAYEAEWLRPAFQIWNLEHEFIHYLDGRYDMKGGFGTYLTANTIWWIEGLAEYVAYIDNNPTALDALRNAPHVPLSTIFRNTYSSGTERVYRWGYFGVRFMFERHRGEVRNILDYFRNGSYATYDSYLLSTIGSLYDSEFQSWMTQVLNGGGANQAPSASFSFNASGLTVNFTDASSDADGSIASRSWNFGDGTSSTAVNPNKTYGSAGTYTVTLMVADNQGATNSTSKSVTVSTSPSGTTLQNGVPRSGLSAATGQNLNFTLDVPAGATNLRFVMSGGTGDADMHVRFGSSPTLSVFDCRPYASGNAETCAINPAQAGRYYVMLNAYAAFSGVTLTGSYAAGGGNTPPIASFSFSTSGLTANFTDSSTDANGTIASRSWNFGDGSSSSAANPIKTYGAAGTYTVTLTVTDNQGASSNTSRSVTVGGSTGVPECTATDTRQLGKNCKRSNRATSADQYDYMFIYLPAGVAQLKITVSGGSGNADLYVSSGAWATMSNYQYSSNNAGNNETLTITSPPSGYLYISLHGASAFSGVTVSTEY